MKAEGNLLPVRKNRVKNKRKKKKKSVLHNFFLLSKGNWFLLIQFLPLTPHLELNELLVGDLLFYSNKFFLLSERNIKMGLAPSMPIFLEALSAAIRI